MTWLHKVRLRVLGFVVGIALAVIATLSWTTLPLWPVVGVAFAAVAVVFNSMTSRMKSPCCWGCGKDIAEQPAGAYGIRCPDCGTINEQHLV